MKSRRLQSERFVDGNDKTMIKVATEPFIYGGGSRNLCLRLCIVRNCLGGRSIVLFLNSTVLACENP